MKMLAIINAELVMKDHYIPDAVLLVEDGKITGFGEMRNTPIPDGCEILDAEGAYVGPGLIDTHNHAGGGKWVFEDPAHAAQFNLRHGTTTMLPTLYSVGEETPKKRKSRYLPRGSPIPTRSSLPTSSSVRGRHRHR